MAFSFFDNTDSNGVDTNYTPPYDPTQTQPTYTDPNAPTTMPGSPNDDTRGSDGNVLDPNMVASATSVNSTAGNYNPGDIGAKNGFTVPSSSITDYSPNTGLPRKPSDNGNGVTTNGYAQPLNPDGTPVTGPSGTGGAGAGSLSSTPAGGGSLSDKDRVLYNSDGSIRGVKDASGYYSGDNWAGYDNIINNAQRGDPFAIDKVAALARLGDARAQTVLGSTPGIGPNFNMDDAGKVGNNSIFQSANFENWRKAHNAEVAQTYGSKFENDQGYTGQRSMSAVQGGNQPNEQIYNNWAGVNLDDLKKMMDTTGRVYKGIDDYGNVHFQGNDGTQKVMPWWDAKNQVTKLYNDYVAANPQSNGSGSGGGRPPYNGRGGSGYGTGYGGPGGGTTPPQGPSTMGTNGISAADANARANQFFPPGSDARKNTPYAVGSAVAYSPAITPGGYSPYDDGFVPPPGGVNLQSGAPVLPPQQPQPTFNPLTGTQDTGGSGLPTYEGPNGQVPFNPTNSADVGQGPVTTNYGPGTYYSPSLPPVTTDYGPRTYRRPL